MGNISCKNKKKPNNHPTSQQNMPNSYRNGNNSRDVVNNNTGGSNKNEAETKKIHQAQENPLQIPLNKQHFSQENQRKFEDFPENDYKNKGTNEEIIAKMQIEIDRLRREVHFYEKEFGKISHLIELNEDLLRQNQEFKQKLASSTEKHNKN